MLMPSASAHIDMLQDPFIRCGNPGIVHGMRSRKTVDLVQI
jgi:hypothetical protein